VQSGRWCRFFGGICSQFFPGSHKLEAVGSSETLEFKATQLHIPEYSDLSSHYGNNGKFQIDFHPNRFSTR
jgi:hypothetical protein